MMDAMGKETKEGEKEENRDDESDETLKASNKRQTDPSDIDGSSPKRVKCDSISDLKPNEELNKVGNSGSVNDGGENARAAEEAVQELVDRVSPVESPSGDEGGGGEGDAMRESTDGTAFDKGGSASEENQSDHHESIVSDEVKNGVERNWSSPDNQKNAEGNCEIGSSLGQLHPQSNTDETFDSVGDCGNNVPPVIASLALCNDYYS